MNSPTLFERSSGVLLHPTSLPGPNGIGDLGPTVDDWLDWLAATGCHVWQVLPLGPTSVGDSPYQCFSGRAGNPLLISPEMLMRDGLLSSGDITLGDDAGDRVNYGEVIVRKARLLRIAMGRLSGSLYDEFNSFRHTQAAWLDDYALFLALKDRFDGRAWTGWDHDVRRRSVDALASATRSLDEEITLYSFHQWLFFRQWARVREAAAQRDIRLFGDMPLYVAADSVDLWTSPNLFQLDSDGHPTVVAGVPPDYFSPSGQLWGNPIYRWDEHRTDGYRWWVERVAQTLDLVDIVRIDHFRGLVDYWEIPAGSHSATQGVWVDGPGPGVLDALEKHLGSLPFVAEDLGDLSPAVSDLRDRFGLAGMRVLQFAWDGDAENPYLPHRIDENSVAYTGTHDNDTTVGWFDAAESGERDRVLRYLGTEGQDIAWDLIAATWNSKATVAIAPLQDVLSLPSSARMNHPGTVFGNWQWRLRAGELTPMVSERLHSLNVRTERVEPTE